MDTLQTRFFQALDALAALHEHEVIVQQSYSNTGNASLVPAGSFQPTVTFKYSFSNNHNVFESNDPIFSTTPPAGSNPNMDIVHGVGEIQRVLDALELTMAKAAVAA